MAFVLIKYSQNKNTDLSVSFYENGCSHTMVISISKEILEKINLKKQDKVKVYVDDENNRKIMIEKSKSDFGRTPIWRKYSCKIQISWSFFEPEKHELGTNKYEYQITDKQQIIINLDKKKN